MEWAAVWIQPDGLSVFTRAALGLMLGLCLVLSAVMLVRDVIARHRRRQAGQKAAGAAQPTHG